jgi:hypothetical protein
MRVKLHLMCWPWFSARRGVFRERGRSRRPRQGREIRGTEVGWIVRRLAVVTTNPLT